jgi:hypothetical protein
MIIMPKQVSKSNHLKTFLIIMLKQILKTNPLK